MIADHGHQFGTQLLLGDVLPGFEYYISAGALAFEVVVDTDDGAFGDGGMAREHRLHRPRGQAVAGDIDDVVAATEHVDVPVGVDVTGVAGEVVTGERIEIRTLET